MSYPYSGINIFAPAGDNSSHLVPAVMGLIRHIKHRGEIRGEGYNIFRFSRSSQRSRTSSTLEALFDIQQDLVCTNYQFACFRLLG